MSRLKFTERVVERLPAPHPSGRQVLYWDEDLKGFGVLCSGVTNSKTFVVQRTLPNGNTRRVTIAAINEMPLARARDEAAEMLVNLRKGNDPKARSLTLQQALDVYLKKKEGRLSQNSVDGYKRTVENHLSRWLSKPLSSITARMVDDRHVAIADEIKSAERGDGRTSANACMRALRAIWNFAAKLDNTLERGIVQPDWFPESRRERIVEEEQMAEFYQGTMALKSDVARDYILFVLFTGLRRREAARLTWEHVDFDKRLIRIPAENTKAKRKLDLPMTDFVRNLLVARRAMGTETSGFVFPSHGKKTGYIAEPKFPLDAIAKASGVQVSVHDLRRTFITVAEQAEISPLALKALVNHALSSDVTEGYVQMRVERLRAPAQKVTDRLKELCGIELPAGENIAVLA